MRHEQRRFHQRIPGVNYGRRWRIARARYLSDHPWCVACAQAGTQTLATELDHVVSHRGDYALFWDETNWQPLCQSCHNRKTATEVLTR